MYSGVADRHTNSDDVGPVYVERNDIVGVHDLIADRTKNLVSNHFGFHLFSLSGRSPNARRMLFGPRSCRASGRTAVAMS